MSKLLDILKENIPEQTEAQITEIYVVEGKSKQRGCRKGRWLQKKNLF